MDHIEAQPTIFPDLREQYETMGRLYQRKLWHQLTDAVEAFVSDPQARRDSNHGGSVRKVHQQL